MAGVQHRHPPSSLVSHRLHQSGHLYARSPACLSGCFIAIGVQFLRVMGPGPGDRRELRWAMQEQRLRSTSFHDAAPLLPLKRQGCTDVLANISSLPRSTSSASTSAHRVCLPNTIFFSRILNMSSTGKFDIGKDRFHQFGAYTEQGWYRSLHQSAKATKPANPTQPNPTKPARLLLFHHYSCLLSQVVPYHCWSSTVMDPPGILPCFTSPGGSGRSWLQDCVLQDRTSVANRPKGHG